MGLSGNYFRPAPADGGGEEADADDDDLGSGMLFSLARVSGATGTRLGSRDEIICALQVMTVDEAFIDPAVRARRPVRRLRRRAS